MALSCTRPWKQQSPGCVLLAAAAVAAALAAAVAAAAVGWCCPVFRDFLLESMRPLLISDATAAFSCLLPESCCCCCRYTSRSEHQHWNELQCSTCNNELVRLGLLQLMLPPPPLLLLLLLSLPPP